MASKRVEQIDIIKGLCMFVVTLGHSLPDAASVAFGSPVYYLSRAIHSSILPLFFFLAGIVATKLLDAVSRDDKFRELGKNVKRMLVPYLVWGLLFIPVRIVFASLARNDYDFTKLYTVLLGNNPCGQLWFLYVLFLFSGVTILFATRKNVVALLPISFGVTLVSHFATLKYDGISWSNSLFLFFFYYLGLFLSLDKERVFKCMRLWAFVCSAALFSVMLWLISHKFIGGYMYLLCRIVISLALIYMALYISDLFHKYMGKTKCVGALREVGRYSMDIYIFHSPLGMILRVALINILGINRILYSLIYIIVGVVGSYLISKFIVRRVPLFRTLFLGMPFSDKKAIKSK